MPLPRKRITRAKRTKRTYLGSGAGSMRSGTGTTAKAKSKKTKSTQTKATELLKKSLITPKVIKAFKNERAFKKAVNKAIKSSPPGAAYKGVKAASKVIKKRTKPTARTMRKKAKR